MCKKLGNTCISRYHLQGICHCKLLATKYQPKQAVAINRSNKGAEPSTLSLAVDCSDSAIPLSEGNQNGLHLTAALHL